MIGDRDDTDGESARLAGARFLEIGEILKYGNQQ
jgi:hypothetical protein